MTEYHTILTAAEDEFTEKRSRFLGAIAPVSTPEEAAAFLAARKTLHREARHTVFAYRLLDGVERYSDDGEPQGTGGQPVLEVLRRLGLTNVCVAVTRYFGGILLGAGGLTRAYAHGAVIAAAAAERVTMCPCTECTLRMDYSQYGIIGNLLPDHGAEVLDTAFTDIVTMQLRLRSPAVAGLTLALSEATGGTVCPLIDREVFAPMAEPIVLTAKE